MAKWRVYNRHPHGLTHVEEFKEQLLKIPAGEYVLMDYEEAVQFRGQYFPMKKNGQDAPDPSGFKCIELKPDTDKEQVANTGKSDGGYVCHFDGAKFPTQALLDKYIKDNYADHSFEDQELESEMREAKRGPGRPPKERPI